MRSKRWARIKLSHELLTELLQSVGDIEWNGHNIGEFTTFAVHQSYEHQLSGTFEVALVGDGAPEIPEGGSAPYVSFRLRSPRR